jgi:hypothetical protein
LSIGADRPLDRDHLKRLKHLIQRCEPGLFSEHLAWSTHEATFLNDLLALPYTAGALARVSEHIDEVQEMLGRQMLLENPWTYLAFAESTYSEIGFIAEIVRRTGCSLSHRPTSNGTRSRDGVEFATHVICAVDFSDAAAIAINRESRVDRLQRLDDIEIRVEATDNPGRIYEYEPRQPSQWCGRLAITRGLSKGGNCEQKYAANSWSHHFGGDHCWPLQIPLHAGPRSLNGVDPTSRRINSNPCPGSPRAGAEAVTMSPAARG